MRPISGATINEEPEAAGRLQRCPGEHGSDHEEVAVSQIDDVKKAEDDRQPQRDQGNNQAPDKAIHA
jgi:hypothetical protein